MVPEPRPEGTHESIVHPDDPELVHQVVRVRERALDFYDPTHRRRRGALIVEGRSKDQPPVSPLRRQHPVGNLNRNAGIVEGTKQPGAQINVALYQCSCSHRRTPWSGSVIAAMTAVAS